MFPDQTNINTKEKIVSLQALRALAFFGIFFSHALRPTMWATLSVSVFFVLSGFLMFIRYSEKETTVSFKDNFRFALSKTGKMYPLHIITMVLALVMNIVLDIHNHVMNAEFGMDLVIRTLLDIPLLTAWAPDFGSLNGVAWYLSAMFFLYFMFPFFKNRIRDSKQGVAVIKVLFILVIQIISYKIWIDIVGYGQVSGLERLTWFSYYFPVFRLGDFVTGCCLGKFCLKKYGKSKNEGSLPAGSPDLLVYSVAEAGLLVLSIFLVYYDFNTVLPPFISPGFNMTTVYIPFAAAWVYLFSVKKGLFTLFSSNRLLIHIGDLSPYLFLIHSVVTFYTDHLLKLLDIEPSGIVLMAVIFLEFAITYVSALIYKNKMQKAI